MPPFKKATYDKDLTIIKELLRQVNKSLCSIDSSTGDTVNDTTRGGYSYATIQDTATASETVNLNAADEIRIVTVMIDTATRVEIGITLADASNFTHLLVGPGTWQIKLENHQSPVTQIVVTELDDTATNVSINYLST